MDLLTDIFKNSGIQKRILHHRRIEQKWAFEFPCEKSIGFHIVSAGEAYLWTNESKSPTVLKRGDIAFMARGVRHWISTEFTEKPHQSFYHGEPLALALQITSGAYTMASAPIHPLFNELPQWMILKYDQVQSFSPIHSYIQLLELESTHAQLGSEMVISSLLDILFQLILRKMIEENALSPNSWCYASQDKQLAQVLSEIHQKPEFNWNLEDLAKVGGMSRATFAARFKKAMGDSPLNYLNTIRMQKAMDLLLNGTQTLEVISSQVGYSDAFTFSKSFKKKVGLSPREFRNQNNSWKAIA